MATDPLAATRPVSAGAAVPPRPPAETKWQNWLRTHQRQALLGAGAAVAVGIALWRRHKNAADATGTTTPATDTSVPADATSAGGIPGSYAPYDGGGFDSGTPTGSDAISTINALGGLLSGLPKSPGVTVQTTPKPKPTRTVTTRTVRVNPPGKHNTTVKHVRTVQTTRPVRRRKKKAATK